MSRGWSAFTSRWLDFLVIGVAAGLIVGLVAVVIGIGDVTLAGLALLWVVSIVVAVVVSLVQTKVSLAAVDLDRKPLGALTSEAMPRVGAFIGWGLLAGLIVFVGLMLCILPGVVAAFFLMFVPFLAVEGRGANPLQGSFAAVKQEAGNLLLLFLVFVGLAVASSIVGALLSVIPVVGPIAAQIISFVLFGFVICTLAVVYRASAVGRAAAD